MGPSSSPRNALTVTRPSYDFTNPEERGIYQFGKSQDIELLTLKYGYDTPYGNKGWQKKPWTDFSEEEGRRELWSDKWPRVSLRSLLYETLGDHAHEKDGDTILVLFISHVEIRLKASNTGISCNLSFSRPCLLATVFFFTNISSILKDN